MAISVCDVSLTESPLDLPMRNEDLGAGAVVVFWGAVRALEDDREITGIEYEAHHEMAEQQMRIVAESAAAKFGLREVVLRHRFGFVAAGGASAGGCGAGGTRRGTFCARPSISGGFEKGGPAG